MLFVLIKTTLLICLISTVHSFSIPTRTKCTDKKTFLTCEKINKIVSNVRRQQCSWRNSPFKWIRGWTYIWRDLRLHPSHLLLCSRPPRSLRARTRWTPATPCPWTRSWSGRWRPSATWWTRTSASSTSPSETSCPRPSCTSWSTVYVFCLFFTANHTLDLERYEMEGHLSITLSLSPCRLRSVLTSLLASRRRTSSTLSCWPTCTRPWTRAVWWRSRQSRLRGGMRCWGCITLWKRRWSSSETSPPPLFLPQCLHQSRTRCPRTQGEEPDSTWMHRPIVDLSAPNWVWGVVGTVTIIYFGHKRPLIGRGFF